MKVISNQTSSRKRNLNSRRPAYLQVTRECNNECIFCSNPQFYKEYRFDDIKKRIMYFKEKGITEIILTGGEPTLVDSLTRIIELINELNLIPKMITNGIKLADVSFTKALYRSGLLDINTSIHSDNEADAAKLSQKKGIFLKALQGVGNALNVGMHVSINSTINSLNCSRLANITNFFIKEFPRVNHYVFNNLDPGMADGNIVSRAAKNPWIVARFVDMELEIGKTVEILKNNKKTFRIERVPLCYMSGFEEFSTETRQIVKDELYICSFISKNTLSEIRKVRPQQFRAKVDCCSVCSLNQICAGVQREYLSLYGDKELYPVFISPVPIINEIVKR